MSRPRHSDPWWANSRQVFKVDRCLLERGLLMELSGDALRIYLMACYSMHRTRSEVYRIALQELSTLDWSGQQAIDAANEIQAAELLRVNLQNAVLEFRI